LSESHAPLRVVVVDDEELSRQRVVGLLEPREDVQVVAVCDNARDALSAIRHEQPDILFLDIQMPEVDGFELLRLVGDRRPHVIVTTAHEKHAVRGFDEEAVDFLLKPFDRRRLDRALDRAARRIRAADREVLFERVRELVSADPDELTSGSAAEEPREAVPLRKLVVRSRDSKRLVDVDDIRWIEAADYYARLHTTRTSHLIRRSLNWLEDHLDPGRFVRIHRSSIVNVECVVEIVPWSGGSYNVRLDDGTELRLTAGRKGELERLLGQSL
jgi:two-component system LytT family response regulator